MVFLIYRTRAQVQPTLNFVFLYQQAAAVQYVDMEINLSEWYPLSGGIGGKQAFFSHFSLCYPWISEDHCFAETCDWRKQGSVIGAAKISEGNRVDFMELCATTIKVKHRLLLSIGIGDYSKGSLGSLFKFETYLFSLNGLPLLFISNISTVMHCPIICLT